MPVIPSQNPLHLSRRSKKLILDRACLAGYYSHMKRDAIKWVRDKAKRFYPKGSECEICGATEKLDFHHYYSMTPLFNKWIKENKMRQDTDEEVILVRDAFIEEHSAEIYDKTVTLCKPHHLKLHAIYGKDPALSTATKQMNWVAIQREKNGLA